MRHAVLLLATLALAACGGDGGKSAPEGSPRSTVTDLENVLQLRSDFEAAAGKTRVLLVFSPT